MLGLELELTERVRLSLILALALTLALTPTLTPQAFKEKFAWQSDESVDPLIEFKRRQKEV